VTRQFRCGVEGVLAGETPESQLVASLPAGEAVPDVTTEIGADVTAAPLEWASFKTASLLLEKVRAGPTGTDTSFANIRAATPVGQAG
jgi:hypothetical protein